MKGLLVAGVSLMALAVASRVAADDIMVTKAAPVQYTAPAAFDWSGFYAGGHLGDAWGSSNWTGSTPGVPIPSLSGSFGLFQPFDGFKDTGSFFEGLQAGYNYMLLNRLVIGGEADVSFPSFPNSAGILVGDGQLPHPGFEEIIEAYYSYALTAFTRVSIDYQFIANPAYNTDRGPVNVFAGRFHTAF